MDAQPSTSSGAMDERRKAALQSYRDVSAHFLCAPSVFILVVQKMVQHETISQSLKNRECLPFRDLGPALIWFCSVRFSLKDLEKEYEKTEEHIKAVQSVGQIIGEVMKQLDDERCTYFD
jgi:26S proteasome regulatory subunit T4